MFRAVKVFFILFILAASVHGGFPSVGPEGLRFEPEPVEARFGRMRSFGFRGSRGMFRRRSFRPSRRSSGTSRSRFRSSRRGLRSGGRRSFLGGFGGFGGGFMGGMAGMFLGGMIGRMMFGGMGHGGMGYGGGGGGIGLLEILLIGGGIFLFMRYLRNRQAPAYSNYSGGRTHHDDDPYDVADDEDRRYSGGVYRGPDIGGGHSRGSGPVAASYAADSRAEEGIPGITSSDSSFSQENFLIDVRGYFQRFQTAWSNRDLSPVRNLLDGDIFEQCQGDLEALRSQGQMNRLDNIDIHSLSLAESWQEDDFDFITVTYEVSLLDYVVSESTGEVIKGSSTESVRFTEHWTWARPSGSNPWILTAIGQS